MEVLIVGRRLGHHPHASDAGTVVVHPHVSDADTVVVHSFAALFQRRQARCFVVDGVIRLSFTLDDHKLQ